MFGENKVPLGSEMKQQSFFSSTLLNFEGTTMEELLLDLFNAAYALMNHKLLLVESSHLLFNSDKALGEAIGQPLDAKTASLKRTFGRIYVLSGKSLERNEILISLPPNKYVLKVQDDDSVLLTTKEGNAVPTKTVMDLLEKLQDKLKGFDACFESLNYKVRCRYGYDLETIIEEYQSAWAVLKETDKNDEDYKEFSKMLRYHREELFDLLWNYYLTGEAPSDIHLLRFFRRLGRPAVTFSFLLDLLPKIDKQEGKYVDNHASFEKMFAFLDKHTKEDSPFEKLPALEEHQEEYKNGEIEGTRLQLLTIFNDVFKTYSNLLSSENVDEDTQDLNDSAAECLFKYDFENVWTDGVSTSLWTIQSVINGYILNKVDFNYAQSEVTRRQWSVFPQLDEEEHLSFNVIPGDSILQFLTTGKYLDNEMCSYDVEIVNSYPIRKSGRKVVTAMNLKRIGEDVDLLEIKHLKIIWKPAEIELKDLTSQINSQKLETLSKQWELYRKIDLGHSLFFQRLMFSTMRYLYIGAYERKQEGKGFPYYYQISKTEGPLADAALSATPNNIMVYVVRILGVDKKRYIDYINFDLAMKGFRAPDTCEDKGVGVRRTTQKETDALNLLMENEGDGRLLEDKSKNPFYFDNKGNLDNM